MSTLRDVRRWALSRRIDVPSRGALPTALVDAFNATHPDDPCAVVRKGWLTLRQTTAEQRAERWDRERARRANGDGAA